jgi:hypothetical protein
MRSVKEDFFGWYMDGFLYDNFMARMGNKCL